MDERRRLGRFRVDGEVQLWSPELDARSAACGRLVDLSGGGALVELVGSTPPAAVPLLARLQLGDFGAPAFPVRAVRAAALPFGGATRRVGLRFQDLSRRELGELATLLSRALERPTLLDRWDSLRTEDHQHLLELQPGALMRIALRGAGRVFRVVDRPRVAGVPHALRLLARGDGPAARIAAQPPAGWSSLPPRDVPLMLAWTGRRSLIVVRAVLQGDVWPAALVLLRAALVRRRRHDRVVLERGALWARFDHPLLQGRHLACPVVDIGEGGMCLEGDAAEDALPPGLPLQALRMVLPNGVETVLHGTIRSVRLARETGGHRFGIEFGPGHADEGWDRFVLGQLLPDAGLLRPAEVEQVWELFDRTGYLKEKDPALLIRRREPFQRSWRRLAAAPQLGAGIVVRERQALRGAMFYTHAWPGTYLLHHLALDLRAAGDGLGPAAVAGEVYRYVYHLCRRMPDLRHAVGLFNVRSSWWRFLFDEFHEQGPPPDWYSIDRLRLMEAPARAAAAGTAAGARLSVSRLHDAAVDAVERAACRVLPRLVTSALALAPLDPTLATLDDEFRGLGLRRTREVWIVQREGRLLGAAIADCASPGINIFGLLDAVQLVPADEGTDEPAWPSALLAAVAERRCAAGADTLGVLVPAEQPGPPLPSAFVEVATLKRWTAARELLPLYLTYLDEHFGVGRSVAEEELR